jgi:hypothetical protein
MRASISAEYLPARPTGGLRRGRAWVSRPGLGANWTCLDCWIAQRADGAGPRRHAGSGRRERLYDRSSAAHGNPACKPRGDRLAAFPAGLIATRVRAGEFFPPVRSIDVRLPKKNPANRLACDCPMSPAKTLRSPQELTPSFGRRNALTPMQSLANGTAAADTAPLRPLRKAGARAAHPSVACASGTTMPFKSRRTSR